MLINDNDINYLLSLMLKHTQPFLPHYHVTCLLQIFSIARILFFNFSIENIQSHTFQLYCSSRPALTVIDRCLQSHSAKSDMRHMGVPPSCHVCLPMSPLWLKWRWQDQSGACQSNRKRRTHSLTDRDSLSLKLLLSTPLWVCLLSLASQTSSEQGCFPSLPPLHRWLSLGLHAGNARHSAGSLHPIIIV